MDNSGFTFYVDGEMKLPFNMKLEKGMKENKPKQTNSAYVQKDRSDAIK